MNWILILYIYAGTFAHGDSVTLFAVPGFKAAADCERAASDSAALVADSFKVLKHVCVRQ
jgi:hypothetical protein